MDTPSSSEPTSRPKPDRPAPHTATDLASLAVLLDQLRAWVSWPRRPISFERLDELAKENPRVGPGVLSRSTMHRALREQKLSSLQQDPVVFVEAFVIVLGVDPDPWVRAASRLTGAEPGAPARRTRWRALAASRRVKALVAVLVLAAAGLVAWRVTDRDEPVPPSEVDFARPARIELGATDLRLAIDRVSNEPGARAVVLGPAEREAAATWELVAPHRNNPDYRQLRPAGTLLMCLEVVGELLEDRAPVQQWYCNGGTHQYWKPERWPSGAMRFVNLNSGQCLGAAHTDPQAGTQLVQRECDEQDESQRWRMTPTTSHPTGPTQARTDVGPDPAEYAGGGKDQPCAGLEPELDPATAEWSNEPVLIRDEDATRGRVGFSSAAAVELVRAHRRNEAGQEKTFYWAEGWAVFTPRRFRMALQWTTARGPGGWHTCPAELTVEHGRVPTVALPRDGVRHVWFRACLTYLPEPPAPRAPVTECTGRY